MTQEQIKREVDDTLDKIRWHLIEQSNGWRNTHSDRHGIANAVQVALIEVANAINAVVQKDK